MTKNEVFIAGMLFMGFIDIIFNNMPLTLMIGVTIVALKEGFADNRIN